MKPACPHCGSCALAVWEGGRWTFLCCGVDNAPVGPLTPMVDSEDGRSAVASRHAGERFEAWDESEEQMELPLDVAS